MKKTIITTSAFELESETFIVRVSDEFISIDLKPDPFHNAFDTLHLNNRKQIEFLRNILNETIDSLDLVFKKKEV